MNAAPDRGEDSVVAAADFDWVEANVRLNESANQMAETIGLKVRVEGTFFIWV